MLKLKIYIKETVVYNVSAICPCLNVINFEVSLNKNIQVC